MEDACRIPLHDSHLASRRAEEAALRRFQAAEWLETLVGPIGLPCQPSEPEFLSYLRNGLFLCNAINKIQPGAVPKVVENHSSSTTAESQPLPAYQYFENVRNFLLAVKELKLPAFEASDLERDTLEAGSAAKIVDCILALKSYHEWKQLGSGNGSWKYARSPMVSHLAGKIHSHVAASSASDACRRLDMLATSEKQQLAETETLMHGDTLVKVLAGCLFDSKENIDQNLLVSFRHGNQDSCKLLIKMLSSCSLEQLLNKYPKLQSASKDFLVEANSSFASSISVPLENSSAVRTDKCCHSRLKTGDCNHWSILEAQEKDLLELKDLLLRAKEDFKTLQLQLQSDLIQLGSQVQGLSTAALGYHRVVKENRDLYNTLQDLKGNIRVYCRIRPAFGIGIRSTVDFIGDNGSLIIVDPLKPQKDSHKFFQFNKVFGPAATQEEVFRDTRPLIRSVMDGYNVCIFAYGQTGSGKTHTMCGPSSGSSKDMGINYLALDYLFQISCNRKDVMRYEVRVQMVEIYNEQVRDLLAEDASTTKLEIRNGVGNGGLNLPNANMHLVQSTMDVLNLMKLGEMNRVVCSTAANNRSSRSHSVVTVHVQGKDASGAVLRSCLHLVDLAGNERVDKSEVTGDRLKEAQHINRSLSCLGDVIAALAQKNSHIPYRNSKLTQLLQDSLGGHAKTLMFAHVSPEADSYAETISTLKFAQRVSTVELGAPRLNKESKDIRELKEEIEGLKKALARKEGETTFSSYKPKELRSPIGNSNLKSDRTPPRPRRLSIENPSIVKSVLLANSEDKKVSKSFSKLKIRTERSPTRLRRLSLEGPNSGKKIRFPIKKSEDDAEANSSGSENCNSIGSGSAVTQVFSHHSSIPRNTASQAQRTKTESRMRIPLQLPKTPELPSSRKLDPNATENEPGVGSKSQLSNSSTSRKGSQIRKSLQTIGKLINGSERRNRQDPLETCSPIYSKSNINDGKAANTRLLRRQSLTGGLDSSRRSSLGGKSTDSCPNGVRNATTPPPVLPSTGATKRWL
ncbi:kinesin-like protein KIN-14L [Magnolia sinica]|uniref:kinesin-like protein KIN-14L n=1 Tax=Magnolia sinica TaxID=86752 RepID=UPI00265B5A5C|nr:kinesin-like protein KIN-14L [Magnolia sinica]